MAVSYNRLFKILIDRKMMKKELCEKADISPSTMSKMGRGKKLSPCPFTELFICCKLIFYLISSKVISISSTSISSDSPSSPSVKSTTNVASNAMISAPTRIPTR